MLIDTSAVLSHLDGSEKTSPLASHVIDAWVAQGRNPGLVSALTVMECAVRPIARQLTAASARLRDFFVQTANLSVEPVDLTVAVEAAAQRALHRFAPVDAIIVATAIVHEAAFLVTGDREWERKLRAASRDLQVVCLPRYV